MLTTNIEVATTHAKTQWLKDFILEYFPKLDNAQISIEDFAAAVDRLLTDRDLHDLKQQKNPRSNIVCALKSIDPNHPAIPPIALTAEQYRDLNQSQQLKLASRETKYITQSVGLVAKATELLESAEWSDIAAGLAFLIGRRIGEIMLSKFTLNTAWSLDFSEMSKKALEHQVTIEIPTLAPAAIVLAAIDRLKHTLNIDDLQLESLNPAAAKKKVSDKYSQAVSTKCDRHYQHLIPTRSDRESLYTHVFRAAYCAISIHWYCPPHVPEHHYRAEILGHYTLGSNGEKIPDYKAGNNYADYVVGDDNGNRDGRLGIKLGTIPNLHVLKAFTNFTREPQMPNPEPVAPEILTPLQAANRDRSNAAKSRISLAYTLDLDEEREILADLHATQDAQGEAEIPPEATTQPLKLWEKDIFLRGQEPQSILDSTRMNLFQQPDPNIAWFISEIQTLRDRLNSLESDNEVLQIAVKQQDRAPSNPMASDLLTLQDDWATAANEVDRLTAENETLKANWATAANEVDRLTAENETLKANWATAANEVDRLTALNQSLESRLAMFRSVLDGNNPSTVTILSPPAAGTAFEFYDEVAMTPHEADVEAAMATPAPARIDKPASDGRAARYTRSLQEIDRVVTAMINWNDKQDRSDRRLLISYFGLKPILRLLGATSQAATTEVLSRRASELFAHHSKFAIGQRHNSRVDLMGVLSSIARDELKLANWSDLKI